MTTIPVAEGWIDRALGGIRAWPGWDRLRELGRRIGALLPRRPRTERVAAVYAEATPLAQAYSIGLTMLCTVLAVLLVNLLGVSQLQHMTTQSRLYSELRADLYNGTAPTGPLAADGSGIVPLGAPVAVMQASTIGIDREVIVDGTGPAQTMQGIGFLRDTSLPCQAGTTELMARSGAYGGIGAQWSRLAVGDTLTVTMQQGSCTYRVIDHRFAGDLAPAVPASGSLLTLVSASGWQFIPTGVYRIDLALVGTTTTDTSGSTTTGTTAFPTSGQVFPSTSLTASEQPMAVDTSQLFPLVLLLEALIGLVVLVWWLWRRWNKAKIVIVAIPIALALAFLTASSVDLLLPNLI